MPRYEVCVAVSSYYKVTVDADTEDQAKSDAKHMVFQYGGRNPPGRYLHGEAVLKTQDVRIDSIKRIPPTNVEMLTELLGVIARTEFEYDPETTYDQMIDAASRARKALASSYPVTDAEFDRAIYEISRTATFEGWEHSS